MGTYPYAYLWFGIAGEQGSFILPPPPGVDPDDWDGDVELGEWLAAKDDLTNPFDEAPDFDPEFTDWINANGGQESFDARVREYRDRATALQGAAPVVLLSIGSADSPWQALAVKGYSYMASWDSADEVKTAWPEVDQVRACAEFCRVHGLPEFKNPGWNLTASYG